MAVSNRKRLELQLPGVARAFVMPDEPKDDRAHARVWAQAAECFATRKVVLDRAEATLELRWQTSDDGQPDAIQIDIVLALLDDMDPRSADWLLRGLPQIFLTDMFVAMNLSCPSSFTLLRAKLLDDSKKEIQSANFSRISSYMFDAARTTSYQWPPISNVPLAKVLRWLDAVRPIASQKPSNQMERALFTVMNLAMVNADEPVSAVWITRTLECLFDSKPGVGSSILLSRIQALHKATEKQRAFAKKSLKGLYDLKNGLVHGGANFVHPLRLEFYDKHRDDEDGRMFGATDFGYRLIISTLQEIIRKRWTALSYAEVVRGEKYSD